MTYFDLTSYTWQYTPADSIMRKIAIDEPSEACSHLVGRTAKGRQLGLAGFGISVGSFATQVRVMFTSLQSYQPYLTHTHYVCIYMTYLTERDD